MTADVWYSDPKRHWCVDVYDRDGVICRESLHVTEADARERAPHYLRYCQDVAAGVVATIPPRTCHSSTSGTFGRRGCVVCGAWGPAL